MVLIHHWTEKYANRNEKSGIDYRSKIIASSRQSRNYPLAPAANGFSNYAFGGRFHCQDGHFVGVDPADGQPALRFTFHNHSGKVVVVDLKGEQPVYVGDLPVDASAQPFFDQVWKSSHCQE